MPGLGIRLASPTGLSDTPALARSPLQLAPRVITVSQILSNMDSVVSSTPRSKATSPSATRTSASPTRASSTTMTSTPSPTDSATPASTSTIPFVSQPVTTGAYACDDGQVYVWIVDSSGKGQYKCDVNQQYRPSKNHRGPVIGGSLGAVFIALLIIAALIIYGRYKRKRYERLAYEKDTVDLANELSAAPLLGNETGSSNYKPELGLGTKLALAFGLSKSRNWKTSSESSIRPLIPAPEEAGTELTMDIVNRPIEKDATLEHIDGSIPYRTEKTADAYPILIQYPLFQETAGYSPNYSSASLAHGNVRGSPRRMHAQHQAMATSPPTFESPDEILTREYAMAQMTGDAAIEAARQSSSKRESAQPFNPFNAVPSVRSSPTSSVARKPSEKS